MQKLFYVVLIISTPDKFETWFWDNDGWVSNMEDAILYSSFPNICIDLPSFENHQLINFIKIHTLYWTNDDAVNQIKIFADNLGIVL